MAPRSIVETFDVGEDVTSGVLPCCIVLVMDELGLERVEETLHRGIVVAIGLAAHGRLEAGGLQRIAILRRSILNAAIGMVDQAGARPLHRDGHAQGCQRQLGAQMIRRPTILRLYKSMTVAR